MFRRKRNVVYKLFEIGRTSFFPFTFFTFCDVFNLAAFEKGLHFYFSAACAHKSLCRARSTAVFTRLSHVFSPEIIMPIDYNS